MEENLRRCSGYIRAKGNPPNIQYPVMLENVSLHLNLNFSAGHLLLPLLHHYSRLCADHKAQLPPTPNERPRKRKYLKLKPVS